MAATLFLYIFLAKVTVSITVSIFWPYFYWIIGNLEIYCLICVYIDFIFSLIMRRASTFLGEFVRMGFQVHGVTLWLMVSVFEFSSVFLTTWRQIINWVERLRQKVIKKKEEEDSCSNWSININETFHSEQPMQTDGAKIANYLGKMIGLLINLPRCISLKIMLKYWEGYCFCW